MKNAVIVLTVVVAAIYFIFFHGGSLKNDISFQGETYGYAKHMYGGAIDKIYDLNEIGCKSPFFHIKVSYSPFSAAYFTPDSM